MVDKNLDKNCALEVLCFAAAGAMMGGVAASFPALLEIVAGHDYEMIKDNFTVITAGFAGYAALAKSLDCYLSGDKNKYS
tara:strand:- start:36122 stop:36361 length:240 start_codon:yes stop_codon:yes gene_type:complete